MLPDEVAMLTKVAESGARAETAHQRGVPQWALLCAISRLEDAKGVQLWQRRAIPRRGPDGSFVLHGQPLLRRSRMGGRS